MSSAPAEVIEDVPRSAGHVSSGVQTSGKNLSAWAIWLVVLACLPVVYAHFVNLLSKPHYQYAALIPLGIWAVWNRDLRPSSRSFSPLHWAPLLFLLLGTLGLGAAAWAGSPWLGMVASLVLVLPCLWWYGGSTAWRTGWRGWLVAWTLVPLPFGMDEDLTLWLRTITTKITSRVLDEIGVLHLSYANVIELPGKPLFIADACSGINSLYVLMTAGLFLAMWFERSILHTLLLLVLTFYLVLVENVARLVLVAVAWNRQMDLSQGTPHMLLGVGLFIMSLLLVLSGDQFLRFLIPQGPIRLGDYFRKNPYFGGDEYFRDTNASHAAPVRATGSGTASLQWPVVLCLSAPLPLIGLYQMARFPSALVPQLVQADVVYPEFGADALPQSLAGFERVDYTTIHRVPGDPMGRDSQQWTYRRGPIVVRISVDSPYLDVHDMTICYQNVGWTLDDRQVLPSAGGPSEATGGDGPVGVARMQRALHGHAMVFWSQADQAGKLQAMIKDEAIGDVTDRQMRRWNAVGNTGQPAPVVHRALPYVQFHMLVQGDHAFDETQRLQLLELYRQFRHTLMGLVREDGAAARPSAGAQP